MKRKTVCFIISMALFCGTIGLYSQTSMAETAYDYGKKLFQEKFYDLAILQFQQFLENYPSSPEAGDAWSLAGESQFLLKRYESAQKSFLNLIVQFPNHEQCAKAHFMIAQCFESMNHLESAILLYQRTYEYYPDHPMGHEGLYQAARLSLKNRQVQQAQFIVQRLLTNKLAYDLISRGQFLLADIYMNQSQFESALEILKPIYETGIRKSDRPIAGLRIAFIYYRMGKFDQSQTIYSKIILETQNDSLRQLALYQSGVIAYRLHDFKSAKRQLKLVVELTQPFSQFSLANYYLGVIAQKEGLSNDAVSYFKKAIESTNDPMDQQKYRLQIAQVYLSNNEFANAEKQLQWILSENMKSNSLRQQAFLFLAKTYFETGDPESAFQQYHTFMTEDASDPIIPYLLMRKSESYLHRGLLRQAWSLFREIWEQYPNSELAPKAYYLYAKSLKAGGDMDEAVRAERILNEKYNGSVYADSVDVSVIYDVSNPGRLNSDVTLQLHALLLQAISQPDDPDSAFEYARFLINRLHFDAQAIPFLRRSLASESYQEKSSYYLGLAYLNLLNRENNLAFKDSASQYLNVIIQSYPASAFAVDAIQRYSKLMAEPEQSKIRRYKKIFSTVSDPIQKNELCHRLGEYYFNMDSLDLAKAYFQTWANTDEGHNSGMPQYYLACIQVQKGFKNSADSLFKNIVNTFPNHSKMAHILYERGRIAQKAHNLSIAMNLFQQVKNQYPYTYLSDSAAFYMGQLLIEQKKYPEAVQVYTEIIQDDSLKSLAYDVGLVDLLPTLHPQAMIGLAKAYEGLGQYIKAQDIYFKYHEQYALKSHTEFYLNMARISESQKNYPRAIQYVLDVLKNDPSDRDYERLGGLYEKSQAYDQAYDAYQQAITQSKDEDFKVTINQKLILCLLRQDKLPAADTRINVFDKSFRKNDNFDILMAEILLEQGKAQFRQKNFKQAEALFERVRDKFKRTPFRALADLEIGRTFIITNKLDEAMQALTKMTDEYKNDPIYYQVYLNLGDLYFRNRQFENALTAFKIVQQDSQNVDNQKLAARYLIRIYETMGLFEAALALTRQYIQTYPDADDVVHKKVQIGNFYMRLKDYNRAINQFQKAQMEADSETEAEIQYWIGKCYAEMGNFEQAILEYLKVKYISKPTKLPWASTAMYEAAMAYLKIYKSWEAKVIFEKIVRFEGSTSDLGRIAKQRIDEIDQGKYAEAGQ